MQKKGEREFRTELSNYFSKDIIIGIKLLGFTAHLLWDSSFAAHDKV